MHVAKLVFIVALLSLNTLEEVFVLLSVCMNMLLVHDTVIVAEMLVIEGEAYVCLGLKHAALKICDDRRPHDDKRNRRLTELSTYSKGYTVLNNFLL